MIKKLLGSFLFRTSGIYVVSNILNSAIPFFLLPVLTRYLTPADYGLIAVFQVLVGIVLPFSGVNTYGAISRKYVEKDTIDLPQYIGNCLIILLIGSGICLLCLVLFQEEISSLSLFPKNWLWTVAAFSMAQCIGLFLLTLWQMQGKAVSYGIFRNTQTICNVLFTLLLVIVLNYGWQGRLGAQIFTAAIFSVVALGLLYKHGFLKISFNSEYVKDALSFGIPLIPHALGAFVISMIDRLFITKMVGIADTGIYSVGYQIGMIIGLIENSFNQAWVPWLYSKLAAGGTDVKIKIVRITYCYNLFILLLALGLGWLGPWAIKFFVGREFAGSGIYVVWIATGYAFNGMYKMVCNYIFFIGKTYILAWVTFFSAVANIGLNYVLVSAYGAIGAAQASTLTFFVSFVLTWMLSARVYPMPWGDFRTLFSKNGSDNLKDRDSN